MPQKAIDTNWGVLGWTSLRQTKTHLTPFVRWGARFRPYLPIHTPQARFVSIALWNK